MITNLAFYRFVAIDDPDGLADQLRQRCAQHALLGSIIVAHEGVNAMLAGVDADAEAFVEWLQGDPRFADTPIKRSAGDRIPFNKLVVKVKPEIVTMRVEGVDATKTARHLEPALFREWLRSGEPMVLIDTRNDYEVALGSFRGAVDPHTDSFNEFPGWVDAHRAELEPEKVVMFCTGGIRCEKATSWMLGHGVEDVWQLDGGVLNYFAEVPDAEQDWDGELFVFDDRVAVDTSLRETFTTLCPKCGIPVRGGHTPLCDCEV